LPAEDADQSASVAIDLGLALRDAGRLDAADESFAAAETAESENIRCRAALERSSVRAFVDPGVTADELLRVANRAISVFEASDDDLGLTRALLHVAEVHWLGCRCAEMEKVLARALVHAERAGERREISAILSLVPPAALVGPRRVEDAIKVCGETRNRGQGIAAVEGIANSALAVLEAMEGRFADARWLYRETMSMLEDRGLTTLLASLRMYPGMVELLAGDYEAAERELRRGYDELAALGHSAFLSTTAAFLARPLYALGRYDEALELTRASEEAASPDDIASQVIWRGTRAKLLARDGDAAAATEFAQTAVELLRDTDLVSLRGDAYVDLAETMQLLDRADEADTARTAALELYAAKGNLASAGAMRET
jgi:tetratricopeptide (TPR) repeat protein